MDNHQRAPTMEFPHDFRCPISMEPMKEPVTISTGVTYERKNIEKWFLIYKKNTCPATMQPIDSFEITPNYTLKRLINSWKDGYSPSSSSCSSPTHHVQSIELVSIMKTIESTPFKVTSLKKLKSILETGDEIMASEFKKLGGVEVLIKIVEQVLVDSFDFIAFRACEEALSVLHQLPFSSEDETICLLMKPECLKSMAIMLQRGSAEARLCTVSIFEKMGKADNNHWNLLIQDQGIDVFKSLLEIVSDEISRKASSCALQVLIQILKASKKSRLKAIEAGAVCTLIELVPDSTRSKCEKIMYLIKLMCECADGRLAFVEHGLGIAVVSKKLLNISIATTKIGVKILWLVCNFHPTEKVLEEMLFYGSMKKLVALLHIGGEDDSSTKERVVKILKLHANSWSRYPCFPREMKEYLGLGRDFC
ncbi:hypothetical protein Leryth_008165 [Lithospermum erythrorhizon]|nr:hypothetical protein Leryth_008165 [Lithospermum erythrorhizon]